MFGTFGKRFFLFIALNLVVMLTITTILSILGVGPYITQAGLNFTALGAFCLVWGMGGAFISLALSRVMAKFMMGVQVIDPSRPGQYGDLLQMVHNLARAARLPALPEVGVYQSMEINAFATGPTKSRALVAVSSGILQRMRRDELEAVLGHEISHIANGDMVTMTLLQGVVNAFVMFFARVLAFFASQALASRDDDRRRGPNPLVNFAFTILFEIIFTLIGALIVRYFSRQREYRADAGGARLAGREKMISALRALGGTSALVDDSQAALATLKISGKPNRFLSLFSTHPDLEDRIRRLESQAS